MQTWVQEGSERGFNKREEQRTTKQHEKMKEKLGNVGTIRERNGSVQLKNGTERFVGKIISSSSRPRPIVP